MCLSDHLKLRWVSLAMGTCIVDVTCFPVCWSIRGHVKHSVGMLISVSFPRHPAEPGCVGALRGVPAQRAGLGLPDQPGQHQQWTHRGTRTLASTQGNIQHCTVLNLLSFLEYLLTTGILLNFTICHSLSIYFKQLHNLTMQSVFYSMRA